MIINKKLIQNIPVVGGPITKIAMFIKYKLFNILILEFYYHICSIIKKTSGITNNKRNPLLIVSLTTIPERIDRVYLAIETLLQQSVKPDYLILWLSESDFSDEYLKSKNRATRKLLNQKKKGLNIEYCKDIRSHKKILYTLKRYPKAIVISTDDDIYFPKNWLKELYNSYIENPKYVHCYMARSMRKATENSLLPRSQWLSLYDKFQGPSINIYPGTGAGCLFPPGSFHPEVFNEKVFLKITPNHDDGWSKAMTLMNGVLTKKVRPIFKQLQLVRNTQSKSLNKINMKNDQYDIQIHAIFKKYDLFQYLDDHDPD